MSNKLIMGCYFLFIIGTIICLIGEGSWLGTSEVSLVNSLTGLSVLQVQDAGAWAVPLQVVGFFIHGIPKMISWNYPFLQDGFAALFKWTFLYAISIGVLWGVIQVTAPAFQGIMQSLRNLLPF